MTTIIDYKNPKYDTVINFYHDYRRCLVGRYVLTEPEHNWTGGFCVVTEVVPEPNDPDIILTVKQLCDGKYLGMYYYESLWLFETREVDLNELAEAGL